MSIETYNPNPGLETVLSVSVIVNSVGHYNSQNLSLKNFWHCLKNIKIFYIL